MRYQITNYQLLLKMLENIPEGDACLEWPRGRNIYGYGILWANGRMTKAHRTAWESTVGPIPPGLDVLHKCDNRPCFRPSHLFLGTDLDNNRDCMAKGRFRVATGEAHGSVKLAEFQVPVIRDLFEKGRTLRGLAQEFGVTKGTIEALVRGRTWSHIGGPLPERSGNTKGSARPAAKLTEENVIHLRRLHTEGWSYTQLANRYKVTRGLIGIIVRREGWKHV